MIEIYDNEKKNFLPLDPTKYKDDSLPKGSWINIVTPTIESINTVSDLTGIEKDLLMTSLDEEESARIDFDSGDTLIVLDAPYLPQEETSLYLTAPFIILYNKSYFVTIARHPNELLNEMFRKSKKIEPEKHVRLTITILYRLSTLFISYLKKIDTLTKSVETKLHGSLKNRELFDLMDINKVLVYFSTALNANKAVLSKLLRSPTFKKYNEDADLMEDAGVELDQANEMCTIYRDILAGTMDAFASIISNNLNIVMKTFAIITIVISIPTLISSFFGMNFKESPLYNNQYGFWIVVALSIVLAILGTVILVLAGKNTKVSSHHKTKK
jgi:magnesium transporter